MAQIRLKNLKQSRYKRLILSNQIYLSCDFCFNGQMKVHDDEKSKTYSERLRAIIDSALLDRGISARKASMDVVGNDGLIRDIRAGRIPSADRLEALCDYLGIEFYFGPKREAAELAEIKRQYSDQAVLSRIMAAFGPKATVDDMRKALGLTEPTDVKMSAPFGPRSRIPSTEHFSKNEVDFVTIALHEAWLSAGPGIDNSGANFIDHLAFRRDWLKRIGVSASQSCLARVMGDSMFPTLSPGDMVLLDTSRTDPPVRSRTSLDRRRPMIWALLDGGEARIKRIERPNAETIMLVSDNPDHPPELRTGNQLDQLTVIGKVVWWGHTNSNS